MFKVGTKIRGVATCAYPANRGRTGVVVTPGGNITHVRWDNDEYSDIFTERLEAYGEDVRSIGNEIIATLTERGKQYDASGKEAERSMKKIVTAFNAITGKDLTAVEGWAFMQVLKQVRFFSNTSAPHRDSLIDNGAYALLQAEEALESK